MINIVLTVLVLIFLLFQAGLLVFSVVKVRNFYRQMRDFVTAPDEKQLSPLATVVDAMMHRAGQAMAIEIKTTLMGHKSVAVRQENAIMGDIAQDMLTQQSPLAGLALGAFPTLGKRLAKNPALAQIAMQLFSKMQAGTNTSGNNGSSEVTNFGLRGK